MTKGKKISPCGPKMFTHLTRFWGGCYITSTTRNVEDNLAKKWSRRKLNSRKPETSTLDLLLLLAVSLELQSSWYLASTSGLLVAGDVCKTLLYLFENHDANHLHFFRTETVSNCILLFFEFIKRNASDLKTGSGINTIH